MKPADLPHVGRVLLRILCPPSRRTEIEGDLAEGFASWSRERGAVYARRRLWRELFLCCVWSAISGARFRRPLAERRRNARDISPWEGLAMFHDFRQDVRYGVRTLGKSPAFAAVAVLILGLGIGANSTVFTLVNAALLQDPPGVHAPDELVGFTRVRENGSAFSFGYPDLEFYQRYQEVFSGVAGYDGSNRAVAVGIDDDVAQASVRVVTSNFFDVLGVRMVQGRGFLPEEEVTPFTHPVVVLSHGFWTRHFGADPQVVNQTIRLNGRPFTVVGICAPEFRMVSPIAVPPDLYAPVMMTGVFSPGAERELKYVDGEISFWIRAIARRRPEVSIEAAQAHLDVLQDRWRTENARWIEATEPTPYRIVLTRNFELHPQTRADLQQLLMLLFVVVGIVLLIASANIAILLLARGSTRRQEVGVRAALGASRMRVVRQLLTESLVLASFGGLLGIGIAFWGAKLASVLFPYSFAVELRPNVRVVLFAVLLSSATALLFGLAPAWQLSRLDVMSFVQRGRSVVTKSTFRQSLVVAQLAMAIVLVTGAGLFVRSLRTAQRVDLGFAPERKLLLSVQLANHGYDESEGLSFTQDVIRQIAALPGVRGVTTTQRTPFRGIWTGGVIAPGTAYENQYVDVHLNRVGPNYFETMGIPMVSGRGFTEADNTSAPSVVVVNEATAEQIWPGENAVGKRLGRSRFDATVIGVARNATYYNVGEQPQTQVYLPQLQIYSSSVTFIVSTAGDPEAATRSIEQVFQARDPNLAVYGVMTLQHVVDREIARYRVMAILVTVFGGIALLLAIVGLYGVQSYVVAQRTREIGIRMALGALQRQVASAVLSGGLIVTGLGVAIGVGAAFLLAQFVQSMLFSVQARDPLTFVVVPLLLLSVAAMASLIPARRASRVDPAVALREE